MGKWGLDKSGYGTKCKPHPKTKISFEKYKLPYWQEIIQHAKNAHRLFYGLHSIGWDVAITTDEIMLIEGNDNWGTEDAQFYKNAKTSFKKYFK